MQIGEDTYQPTDYKTLKEAPAAVEAVVQPANRKLAQAWAAPAPAPEGVVLFDGATYTKVSGK